MGDRLWAGKPSRYVTSHQVDSAFYRPWDNAPKKSRFADEVGERYGEIEYSCSKVLQRWRGSGGNVRLSRLLVSFFNTVNSVAVGLVDVVIMLDKCLCSINIEWI